MESFITKDPFFRDTLLQSIQIILPDLIALPVEIEKWETFPQNSGKGIHRVVLDLLQRDDETVTAAVTAVDSEGRVIERLHGYKVKIIGRVKDAPQPGRSSRPG